LASPGRADTSLTPLDAIWDLLRRASLVAARPTGQAVQGAPGAATKLGLLLAIIIAVGAGTQVVRLGIERAVALGFIAVALLGGVLWPWYALWPLIFVALAGTARERAVAAALSGLLLLSLLPGGVPVLDVVPGPADVLYLSAYAVAALAVVAARRPKPAPAAGA